MWCSASSGHVTPSLTWTLLPKGQLVGSRAPNHRRGEQRLADHRVGPLDPCRAGSPISFVGPWAWNFYLCRPVVCHLAALHCIAQEPFLLRTLRGHLGTRGPTSLPVLCTCLAPRASKWFQDQNCSLQGTLALPPSMGKLLPKCWLPATL